MNEMKKRIAKAVLDDLCDRRGIRHAFDGIDDRTMEEIREAIGTKALRAMLEVAVALEQAGAAGEGVQAWTLWFESVINQALREE
jgi:hypothetical protein